MNEIKENLSEIYLVPDKRWELWNCSSQDDFINIFLIKGKFHTNVPKDVIEAYSIVESLIVYSYFNYALIDEAFSKLTRIFEMAVNLKCEELNIRNKVLSQKLSAISKIGLNKLLPRYLKFKELRNYFAHPQRNSLFGVTHKGIAFFYGLNLINSIFKPKEFFEENESFTYEMYNKTKHFQDRLSVLKTPENSYVIFNSVLKLAVKKNNDYYAYFTFYPVPMTFPQKMEDNIKIDTPFYVFMKITKITDDIIEGYDPRDNFQFKLSKAENKSGLKSVEKFKNLFESSDKSVKELYEEVLSLEDSFSIERFMYDYFWD